MPIGEVFQQERERKRLAIQNRLMKEYEQPVYTRLLCQGSGLNILDVGCNDGGKTAERFSRDNVRRVIGLEYHGGLAEQAQKAYGGGRFAFYQCDVEAPDFAGRLRKLMERNHVECFHVIHISFVLLHLKDPGRLLGQLRGFLAPGGRLILVEPNDMASMVSPDPQGLLQHFLYILSQDPLAGDRTCGARLPALLDGCGFRNISIEETAVRAGPGELQKKEEIFEVFFSYLLWDLELLKRQKPDCGPYRAHLKWMEQHYEDLRSLVLAERAVVLMGVSIVTGLGE